MMKYLVNTAKSSVIFSIVATIPVFSFLPTTSTKLSHFTTTTSLYNSNNMGGNPLTQQMTTSWDDLVRQIDTTPVGDALSKEVEIRKTGKGSAHVHNTLRRFHTTEEPQVTLYRDHAGW